MNPHLEAARARAHTIAKAAAARSRGKPVAKLAKVRKGALVVAGHAKPRRGAAMRWSKKLDDRVQGHVKALEKRRGPNG
jgi:hypothetical protein